MTVQTELLAEPLAVTVIAALMAKGERVRLYISHAGSKAYAGWIQRITPKDGRFDIVISEVQGTNLVVPLAAADLDIMRLQKRTEYPEVGDHWSLSCDWSELS